MKLLITGGAGFIGSNFIHYIHKTYKEDHIVNMDALTYAGNSLNIKELEQSERYKFIHADICDKEAVFAAVEDGIDAIVHFAAESHVDRSIVDPSAFIRTNVLGTQVLLDAAREYNVRFHHVSTDEVYGTLALDDPAFFEETPYDPRSPYAASKAASDHIVRSYYHTYGLDLTISNCSNNYGPYQFPEKLIPLTISNILEGKEIPIYGDGKQRRDWIHVEDHVRGVDMVLRNGTIGETYCLGGNAEVENITIVRKLLALLGKTDESLITYVTDRLGHDRRYAMNITKAKTELGFEPTYTLDKGLAETVAWYTNNQSWVEKCKNGAYQTYYKEQYKK